MDPFDKHTCLLGFMYRLARDIDPDKLSIFQKPRSLYPGKNPPREIKQRMIENKRMRIRLNQFVWAFCTKHYSPLQPMTDLSVKHWLFDENKTYSLKRKTQLLETYRRKYHLVGLLQLDQFLSDKTWQKWCRVECHIKREFTAEHGKHARIISSRTDFAKCLLGPSAHAMEKVIYNPLFMDPKIHFYKGLEPAKRKEFIKKHINSTHILCTDYSSFEGSFRQGLMDNCEQVMYRYLLRHFPVERSYFKRLSGKNTLELPGVLTCTMDATRMSGEMNTSLGNGFTNMIIMLFMVKVYGLNLIEGIVEGDDGIFVFADENLPTEEMYKKFGFAIKIKRPHNFYEASFCGNVINPISLDLLADPVEFISRFPWSYSNRAISQKDGPRLELMLVKTLSYLSLYPNAPVIAPIAYQEYKRLEKMNVNMGKVNDILKEDSEFRYRFVENKEIFNFNVSPPVIADGSRQIMSDVFGMSTAEQVFVEKSYFLGVAHPIRGYSDYKFRREASSRIFSIVYPLARNSGESS